MIQQLTNSTWWVEEVGVPVIVGIIIGIIVLVASCLVNIYIVEKRRERREDEKEEERIKREDEKKLKEELDFSRDSELIYKWLFEKTETYRWITVGGYIDGGITGTLTDTRWRSTEEISANTHIPVKRVDELCTRNKKLMKMMITDVAMEKKDVTEEDLRRWAIREFVR